MIPPAPGPDDPPGQRNVFPFEADRAVIHAFLSGRKIFINKEANLKTHGGVLFMDKTELVWFDKTDGSLVAVIGRGPDTYTARRAVEYISKLMGAEVKFTNERRDGKLTLFYGDQPVDYNQPVTIAGPLGVLAYQATHAKP